MNIKLGFIRLFWVSFVICNITGLLFGIREANRQDYISNGFYGKSMSSLDYYGNYIIGTVITYDILFLMFTAFAYIVIKTIWYVVDGFKPPN